MPKPNKKRAFTRQWWHTPYPDTLQQELAGTYCSDAEPLDEEDIADYKVALESMEREQTMLGDCIMCYECGENK